MQASLFLVVFFLTLAFFEVVLHLKNSSGSDYNFERISESGLKILQSNVDTVIRSGDGNRMVHIKTNEEGFSSENHSIEATTGTKRIAFMGNSFVQGFAVDYEKKMTTLIDKNLQENKNVGKIEGLNFGIVGYSSVEQLLLYDEYVKKYHPDVVVLISYAGYDFMVNRRFLSKKDIILGKNEEQFTTDILQDANQNFEAKNRSLKTVLIEKSEILRHIIRLIQTHAPLYDLAVKIGLLHRPFTEEAESYFNEFWSYMNPDSQAHLEIINFTSDVLLRFKEKLAKDNVKLVYVVVPSYWQVDNQYIEELRMKNVPMDLFLPNKMLKEKVGDQFPILDLSEYIAKAINYDRVPVFINRVGHFTEKGNAMAAEQISQFLLENKKKLDL